MKLRNSSNSHHIRETISPQRNDSSSVLKEIDQNPSSTPISNVPSIMKKSKLIFKKSTGHSILSQRVRDRSTFKRYSEPIPFDVRSLTPVSFHPRLPLDSNPSSSAQFGITSTPRSKMMSEFLAYRVKLKAQQNDNVGIGTQDENVTTPVLNTPISSKGVGAPRRLNFCHSLEQKRAYSSTSGTTSINGMANNLTRFNLMSLHGLEEHEDMRSDLEDIMDTSISSIDLSLLGSDGESFNVSF